MRNLFTILCILITLTASAQSEGTFSFVNTNGTFSQGFGSSGIRIRQGTTAAYSISYTLTQQTDTHGFLQITGSNNKGLRIGPTKMWADLPLALGGGKVATGYQLSVNGKTICTEAWVQPVASWPDYVFTKGYDLPTLASVEEFIKRNSHLPEVPSAADVEANGVNLGGMNAILLKKVEEMTLYMIQANKEMLQMQEKIAQLEKQLGK